MGRVRSNVMVEGRPLWALFDTGTRNTYVTEDVATPLPTFPLPTPEPVALAGSVHRVDQICLFSCAVEGLPIHLEARVLPEIGTDEQGRRIQVLLGALAMRQWGITPVPREERLDMTNYPREFVEFVDEPS